MSASVRRGSVGAMEPGHCWSWTLRSADLHTELGVGTMSRRQEPRTGGGIEPGLDRDGAGREVGNPWEEGSIEDFHS